VPFFGTGIPVEYELIRSITTVGHGDRKKLGVVQTDANLSGGFTFAGGQPRQIPKQLILEELEKQYKVEEVDATNPIEPGKYDALLVVQPSSLGPQQLANLVEAVKQGQPAAIFEDPFPAVMNQVVGTAEPKPPMGGMMGMGGQSQPKGDIRALWKALGIQVTGDSGGDRGELPAVVVWQKFNPYPKFQITNIGDELVFLRNDAPGTKNAFNPDLPVCAKFEELLLPFPTGMTQAPGSKLNFTELIATSSTFAGTIKVMDLQANSFNENLLEEKRGRPSKSKFTLAAWIRGENAAGDKKDDKKDAEKKADSPLASRPINVIYVGDIDMLHSEFVQLRNQPNRDINFRFDNVPFVLNVIDAVAGDERFLEIRTRKPRHSTLKTVEERAKAARSNEDEAKAAAGAEYEVLKKKVEAAQQEAEKKFAAIQTEYRDKQDRGEAVDRAEMLSQFQIWALKVENEKRKAEVELERILRVRDKTLAAVERTRDQDIQQIQNEFKVWATVIPPIPPLCVGLIVWIRRRLREREGVSRSRMK